MAWIKNIDKEKRELLKRFPFFIALIAFNSIYFKFEKSFMEIKEVKEKLHSIIESTDNELLLQNILNAVEGKQGFKNSDDANELSEEDYNDLMSLVNEPPQQNTISYNELKSSLSRWFTK
jgi:hypothetical protein